MEFHDFFTTFESVKKLGWLAEDDTPQSFYLGMLGITQDGARRTNLEGFRAENNRQALELKWYDNGNPYYKVYPGVLGLLTDVKIDIPCKFLKLPFESFVVRLPKEDNPFQVCGRTIKAFMVGTGTPIDDPARGDQFFLWIDSGEIDPIGAPILDYHQFPLKPDMSIEEAAFVLPLSKVMPTDIPLELTNQLLRLAVSVCFLATGSDKLISPDVLSKDVAAWLEAVRKRDNERRTVIEARAERRGKKGWNVGVGERHFVRPRHERSDSEGTGRELSYQHQRSCHFRTLPSEKVIFIRQMTIRADLPTKPVGV